MARRGSETEQTGNIGETAVKLEFERLLWHVAPNPAGEVGSDLLLQARDNRRFDLGAIVGAQVKSGPTFFNEPEHDDSGDLVGWWFRDNKDEYLKYWRDHNAPHIVVLHNETTRTSHWVHVTDEKIKSTGKGSKILVPKTSVIDEDHADELLKVATNDRVGLRWEGSAWDGGASIFTPDQLRYALLTPRLIAPHPNRSVDALRPDQATALLMKMRLDKLDPEPLHLKLKGKKGPVPSLNECRESKEWRWQFYAALHDLLVGGGNLETLEALINTTNEPHERAAATVFACAMRIENGDPRGGMTLVATELDKDECDPVDHDWLVLHKSRCLIELGELEDARRLALEVQRLRTFAPQDPTAMAIAGSGADIIFTAGEWSTVSEVVTGRDTLAAWWRSQEVGWGLQNHFDDHFTAWAEGSTPTADAGDETWLRLRTSSLLAGTAADHSSWRHTSGLRAQHILLFGAGGEDDIVSALTMLCRVGDSKTLERACKRLLQSGPANAVRVAASSIDLEVSTRTSVRADLQLVASAADVLGTVPADVHARWILSNLADTVQFEVRFKPSFLVNTILLETLRNLVAAISPSVRRELIATLLALPPQGNTSRAHDWASVVARIPSNEWTDADRAAIAGRPSAGDDAELRNVFAGILADADPEYRDVLRGRIKDGDLGALGAFGDVRDLDTDTVRGLLEHLSVRLDEQMEQLRRGESRITGRNVAGTMVLVNAWHPDQALWEPIVRLLSLDCVFVDHLQKALVSLRQHSGHLPEEVADTLVEPLRRLSLNGAKNHFFFGVQDIRGEAAGALASIRPSAVSDAELWDLMTSDSSEQRQAAVRLIASRGIRKGIDILWAMSRDDDAWVQSVIANQIAVAMSDDEDDRCLSLLTRLLSSKGTLVARLVAVALKGFPRSAGADKLADLLRDHISDEVRRAVAAYEENTQAT